MSKRAEYTTGFCCASAPCPEPAEVDIDYGHGYVHMCKHHAAQLAAVLWPQGLEITTGRRPVDGEVVS